MSTLTKLSANRLEHAQIMATPCGRCGHELAHHPVSARIEGSACTHRTLVSHPTRDPGKARFKLCRCPEFQEPQEKLL